jgi:hypothetical protein
MFIRCLCTALLALSLSACGAAGSKTPPLGVGQIVTDNDRLGWDQAAANAGELAALQYAFYVDDVRTAAAGVSCGAGDMPDVFLCTSNLPPMSNGSHTVQVAAFVMDAGVLRESSRSAALQVLKQ